MQPNIVRLFRVSDGALLRTLGGYPDAMLLVVFSPDGATMTSGSNDNTVKLWQVSDGTLLRTLEWHTSYVSSVGFSPDRTTLASGSGDSAVNFWRVSDGALDTAGNVYEWAADRYSNSYYSVSPSSHPTGPASGNYYVMHGGSWQLDSYRLHTYEREVSSPDYVNSNLGFRCAQDANP